MKKRRENTEEEARTENAFQRDVAARIHEARSAWKLNEFAARCGVLPQSFARYECVGGSLPGAALLKKICEASGVSADWILGLSEVKQRAQLPPVSASTVNAPATPDAAAVLAQVARILAPAKAPPPPAPDVADLANRLDALERATHTIAAAIAALPKR